MKKIYFIFALCIATIVGCKNDASSKANEQGTSETTPDGYTETVTVGNTYETFSGMFLYLEDEKAAVFQAAGSDMYGVVVDDQMLALDEQCKQYKEKEHDMVPVVIRGIKKPNPIKDAWKEVIEIKEIVSVQKPSDNKDGTIIIKSNQ
ncbi:hypothetical protein [Kordia jejudonensis]|uniref:hypothetical protein n=1 Tax=Kordia jejudonensis TaxID=1348245 RepID=UPI0006290558|nr:hypothetical protein [Kordia jejudonensis]